MAKAEEEEGREEEFETKRGGNERTFLANNAKEQRFPKKMGS